MPGKSMSAAAGTSFALHPQLAQDTVAVGELKLCRLLLSKDANFPWLVLAPRRSGITEIIDLDADAQTRLMTEIADVSHALRGTTRCDKLNVAALGNMVPQLHVHIIARRKSDVAWPQPVWGVAPALAYGDNEQRTLIEALRRKLELDQNE
jgi:diadenosine tetraphosphate (Ap4A) HIT family hydrolase